MARMEDDVLKAIIDAKLVNALGWIGGRLSKERIRAWAYYEGDWFGNEQDGRSKVISRDVAEAIDAVMPGLVKIFASTDQIVQFTARRPEDEALAAQETDFVNWVWQTQPNCFDLLQTWLKDGLMSKLGVVKSWWDEQVDVVEEVYEDQTPFQYILLHNDPDVEIVEAIQKPAPPQRIDPYQPFPAPPAPLGPAQPVQPVPPQAVPVSAPPGPLPGALPQAPANFPGGQVPPSPLATPRPAPPTLQVAPLPSLLALDQQNVSVFDVTVRRANRTGRIRVQAIPPEEFLTDRRAISLEEATFCAHRGIRRISDLIEMGYDPEVCLGLPGGTELDFNFEVIERFQKEDEMPQRDETDNLDPAMRRVWVVECYLRVDYDGDGIAEWRKVVVAGGGTFEILEKEPCDGHIFSAWTPNKMPHKLYGESLADKTTDIQLIKSTLWRELMDAIYQIGSPRLVCDVDRTNLEDATNNRPGGVIRTKGEGAVTPLIQPDNTAGILNAINYVDSVRESRTGVRRFTSATDADALNPYNNTATGARMVEDASQDRIMLMARNFAEQGLVPLFNRLLELTIKHQQKETAMRLRGKWVTVDPSTWTTQLDVSVAVGLGTGNRDTQVMHLMSLMQMVQQIVQAQGGLNGPLVTAKNVYAILQKIQEAEGYRGQDFFSDPSGTAPLPPPPNPQAQMAQAQLALEQSKAQQKAAIDQQHAALHLQLARDKAQHDMALAERKLIHDMEMERLRVAADIDIARGKALADRAAKTPPAQTPPETPQGPQGLPAGTPIQ